MRIKRILIANRGEIAVRIIRTCRELGIETVLASSSADSDSLPARLADRTICIGPAQASESYLKAPTVLHAAIAAKVDAIHPGYGFLAERAVFARLCEQQKMIFIGPTADQIEAVGDKLRARGRAEAARVPVVPGGAVTSIDDALSMARAIGFPLLVKAVGGGGGRGMKRVDDISTLPDQLEIAAAEAGAAFGDARVYLERLITPGRHIEVQILGDGQGGVIHLGERDCSVQRRYQKLLEETPAPDLPASLRQRLCDAAVRFAQELSYRGAGTVEFLVDSSRESFYFLEMNARIQVEHPVTEAVSGIDLIAEQIAIAEGADLRLAQSDIRPRGCAMECRVNAEDPARDFRPSPGLVTDARWPSGSQIRVDTYVESGCRVPPYYDSLMAKIIASGPDRKSALQRMRQAIADTTISGVASNLDFHARLLVDHEFVKGGVDTGFIERAMTRFI